MEYEWKDPETAPKDGSVILADTDLPWAVTAAWSGHYGEWVVASLLVDMADGKWTDTYFESFWKKDADLKGWTELPKLPVRGVENKGGEENA